MHVDVQSPVSWSQSHHYHLLWLTKKVIDILLLTWPYNRFDNGRLFLVAHISIYLLYLCNFLARLLVHLRELCNGRVSTGAPPCRWCWVVVEMLLDVAICSTEIGVFSVIKSNFKSKVLLNVDKYVLYLVCKETFVNNNYLLQMIRRRRNFLFC